MTAETIATQIAGGTIHYAGRSYAISDIEWHRHPEFKGVYLKHMIKGSDTDGLFSAHLVKIDPDCRLDQHIHANQTELHEVLEGEGQCSLVQTQIDYHAGQIAVINKGESHWVQAGQNGLTLMAKFIPALL